MWQDMYEKNLDKKVPKKVPALEEALGHVSEGRQNVYGHPIEDFSRVSGAARAMNLDPRKGPLEHSLYMVLVKISRLIQTPGHRDSIVDIAGYAQTYEMVWEKLMEDDNA